MKNTLRWFTIEHCVELIIVLFAVAGVANSQEYLAQHHNPVTAWALAGGLGGVLVAASIMTARTDFERERRAFYGVGVALAVALFMVCAVQVLAYHEEYGMAQALLFGAGFPVLAEAVLPLALSIHIGARRRRLLADTDDATDIAVASAIADSMGDLEPYIEQNRQYVGEKIGVIVRAKIDTVVQRMLPDNASLLAPQERRQDAADELQQSVVQDAQDEAQKRAESSKLSARDDDGKPSIEQLNEARQAAMEARRMQLLDLLRDDNEMGTSELAHRLDVSPGTVRNDRKALEQRGLLHVNGSVEVMG